MHLEMLMTSAYNHSITSKWLLDGHIVIFQPNNCDTEIPKQNEIVEVY